MPQKDKPSLNFILLNKMHPIWVIISYSCIIICGPKMCGLWFLSILYGLFFLESLFCSIPAITGILLIGIEVVNPKKQSKKRRYLGLVFMYVGLISYFLREDASYNFNTFREIEPLIGIFCFIITSILFYIATLQKLKK
ncbi:MAG: hypothetical protein EAZ35_08220 [Sphingobacteriia bacterium]|nr:MAG: hypothetical protein EAZ35_08220 [Sphingobacteriia bacterium]